MSRGPHEVLVGPVPTEPITLLQHTDGPRDEPALEPNGLPALVPACTRKRQRSMTSEKLSDASSLWRHEIHRGGVQVQESGGLCICVQLKPKMGTQPETTDCC